MFLPKFLFTKVKSPRDSLLGKLVASLQLDLLTLGGSLPLVGEGDDLFKIRCSGGQIRR